MKLMTVKTALAFNPNKAHPNLFCFILPCNPNNARQNSLCLMLIKDGDVKDIL